MALTATDKTGIIEQYKRDPQDTGSAEVQVALLTARITYLTEHFNAEGDEHREFTQLFGPEKVLEHVDGFLGHFMIGKVMAGADFKRSAVTVTKKLSKWLAANGYVSTEAAEDGARRSTETGQDLVVAERATRLLQDAA